MNAASEAPTMVLVHGAWADGSSWKEVILPLEEQGFKVICAPIPLTSFADDVSALTRALERTTGSVVLAGHAYAGAVIGAISEERVKALVYIAALAPSEGETVAQVFYRDEPHPQAPKLAPDKHGFIWMPEDAFQNAFAQNATAKTNCSHSGNTKTDRAEVYSGAGSDAGVEIQAFLVSDRRRRPHDQSQNATLHGRKDERHNALVRRRSHSVTH